MFPYLILISTASFIGALFNANGIEAILGPFVGNNFDPRYLTDHYSRLRKFMS